MRKLLLIALLISAAPFCHAQVFGKIYEIENLGDFVSKHKKVAIIPFNYRITLKKMPKNTTQQDIELQEEKGSISAQNSFFTYAMRKKEKSETLVEFQDISRTKVLLARAGITEKNVHTYLPEELCKTLEVDALIDGDIIASTPMSEGAAVVTTLLVGYSKTNQAKATIKVYDASGAMIWSYGKEVAGGLGTDDDDMIRILMRKTANRFPYFKD